MFNLCNVRIHCCHGSPVSQSHPYQTTLLVEEEGPILGWIVSFLKGEGEGEEREGRGRGEGGEREGRGERRGRAEEGRAKPRFWLKKRVLSLVGLYPF